MIDIETGGTTPGCAIFSIGACCFTPYEVVKPVEYFYIEINHQSCQDLGLRLETSTMEWWKDQPRIPESEQSIEYALKEFMLWIARLPNKLGERITHIWANSPSFDLVIIKYALTLCEIRWDHPFWVERDVRTLKAIAWPNNDYRGDENSHNAVEDAINQTRLVQHSYLKLGLSHDHNSTSPFHRNQPKPSSIQDERECPRL